MLKKASRNSRVVPNVPADDPVGTMDRFTQGLRRVLSVPKIQLPHEHQPKAPNESASAFSCNCSTPSA